MHIPDNYLSPQTDAVMAVAMVPVWVHCIKKVRPTPLQWLQYREDKQWFLEDLPRRLHDKILYRPHSSRARASSVMGQMDLSQ